MGDFKFACPGCGQHIVGDELWGGRQMQCPSCQCELIVPMQEAAAAPVASLLPPSASAAQPAQSQLAGAQISEGRFKVPTAPSAAPLKAGATQVAASTRFKAPPVRQEEEKTGGWKKILAISAVVIVAGVGGYFGFIWVSNMQEKTNEKRRAVERNSDGGEMGHIANLYDVLDATEPGGRGLGGGISGSGPRPRQTTATRPIYVPGDSESYEHPVAAANKALPVVPAVYSMDVATAKIPEGRVNGMISGTNFMLDNATLEKQAAAYLLRLRQGTNAAPDREIRVYLHLLPGERIGGHTWTIAKETKDKNQPSVAKSWKTNPKYAALTKSYATGYAMKLEFGKIETDEEVVSGKVFIALPDPEQTIVAGIFKAETTIFEMPASTGTNAAPAAAAPTAPPMTPAAQKAAMEKRYGR